MEGVQFQRKVSAFLVCQGYPIYVIQLVSNIIQLLHIIWVCIVFIFLDDEMSSQLYSMTYMMVTLQITCACIVSWFHRGLNACFINVDQHSIYKPCYKTGLSPMSQFVLWWYAQNMRQIVVIHVCDICIHQYGASNPKFWS